MALISSLGPAFRFDCRMKITQNNKKSHVVNGYLLRNKSVLFVQ